MDMTIRVSGIAVYAGYSLNGYYFTYESLQGIDTVVPLYHEHNYDRQIGQVRLYTSEDGTYINYDGEIDEASITEDVMRDLEKGLYRVSIGVEVNEYYVYHHVSSGSDEEFILIHSIRPFELSIVKNPAFPLTTLYMQNARRIEMVGDGKSVQKRILMLRNRICDGAGCIRMRLGCDNNATAQYTHKINIDMAEEKPVITNSGENPIVEAVNSYISRTKGHIKFVVNAIDASPFGSRGENGLVPKPQRISARLEEFMVKGRVEGKNAVWTVVPVVEWSTFADGSAPADAAQSITEASKAVEYRGYRQSITDLAKISAPVDLIGELVALEREMLQYEIDKALFDQRAEITNTLDSATAMLEPGDVLTAIRQIRATGNMNDIVLVCPPKVFHDLMGSQEVSKFLEYGDGNALGAREGINEFFIYGIRVRMTSKEVTEEVDGTDKYVSIMFPVGAVGLALGSLEVEIFRDGNALKDVITVKKPFALKYLLPDQCVKIRSG
ncbi:MAG: hypothetical protein RMJ59_02205 [Candidatus Nitrosocaldus sp.]|nr:hypothetical protein [Candidatus Nitrosocaldus sp.]